MTKICVEDPQVQAAVVRAACEIVKTKLQAVTADRVAAVAKELLSKLASESEQKH